MVVFTAADLQRRPAELQRAALREPTYLTYHERLRYVFLSIEDYVRLGAVTVAVPPRGLPANLPKRLSRIATRYDTVEFEGETSDTVARPEAGQIVSGLVYRRTTHSLLRADGASSSWAVALCELVEGEELREATAKGPSGSEIATYFTARADDFLSLPIQFTAPGKDQTGAKMSRDVARMVGAADQVYILVSNLLVDSVPRQSRTNPADALILPGSVISGIASKILQLAKAD